MLIQKQYRKLFLQEIFNVLGIQQCSSLLEKSIVNAFFICYWHKITGYHDVNAKLSDFQLHKLKPAAKKATGVTLSWSSDMIGTVENSFPHNLLLTAKQGASLCKAFANKFIKWDKIIKKSIAQNNVVRRTPS